MALTIDQLNIQIAADSANATRALTSLIKKLEKLKTTLNGTSTSNITISNSFNKTTTATNKATNATNKYNNANKQAGKSTKSLSDRLAGQISKWRTLYGAFKTAADKMGAWFKESNDYIETLNLFNITMGEGADAAKKYADSVSELMGIDVSEWMQYQGTFKQLTSGFGVADKAANTMSKNLTQLSYDLASFFNTDVETAFDKLSSAMSGQVKGLREFGIDTTVASLQEYALSKGIETKVRSMTQAEKSLLRYNYIMEKSINIQGDMARTIVTPANALRILTAQLTQMKRALGNVISVLVVQFIPYVQAMVEIVTDAANALAKFFGFEIPKIDYSGLDTGGFADDLEDAEDSVDGTADALKKIKKQLMGFDELNIISNPDKDSSSGSVTAGAGGSLNGMAPLEYDFLAGLKTNKLDEVKEKLKEIAKWVGIVGAGFAGWKIAGALLGLGPALTGFFSALSSGEGIKTAALALATKFKQAFGVGLMASGAALDISVAIESWADGVSWDGLVDQLKASGLLHLGGFLVGGATGMSIGAILDGVLTLIPSIKSAVADGNKEWSNTLSIIKGISVIAGGIAVLTGNWIPLAVGGVIALGSVIAIYFDDIVNWFKELPAKIGNFFTKLWEDIKTLWGTVSTWFDEKVIQPIVGFFEGLWTSVSGFFVQLWTDIQTVWTNVSTWFDEKVIQPIVNFFAPIVDWISNFFYGCWLIIQAVWVVVSTWFDENVIQPVIGFFRQLWEDIKSVWETVSTWFNENVIIPVIEFFQKLWLDVSTFFVNLWEDIKTTWLAVSTWFNTYVIQPVANFFKDLWEDVSGFFTNLWTDIKGVWNSVASWFDTYVIQPVKKAWDDACAAIGRFFSNLWTGIKNGVVDAMNGVIGGIESALNWMINGINKLINGFSGIVQWAADVLGAEWDGLTTIPQVSFKRINYFEMGGFPTMGEMFIAREAGPELVGSIGRKTAVANNDQIISGIESGVYRAMVAANSNNKGGSQTIRIINEIDGDVVGEKVIQYHNGKVIQTGVSPLLI